jgi:hypothetical protein
MAKSLKKNHICINNNNKNTWHDLASLNIKNQEK